MANDDMFLLSAKLDISKSVQKINEDIKNIQKQLNSVELLGKLSDGVINNIQNQLKEITQKQYDINIGVNNAGTQSQLNQVQKQVVSDVDVIKKETDVLINEMIAKMQSLGTVDLSTFISNLKNNLGAGTKEVKQIATELYQALRLTPNNQNAIAESYTYLMDMIRNNIGNNLIVSDKNFDNRLVAQIYECAIQMNNLGNTSEKAMSKVTSSSQKAEQSVANVNFATKQITSNLIPIETQYVTTFNNVADVIKLAEKEFEKFGEVTATSNKPAFTESGLEYYKDFTIQVKSATGEVQKFKYIMQQGEDGNIFYQLQNINEAVVGMKKLQNDIEKFQAEYTSKLENFKKNNADLGLSKEITAIETALKNLSSYQDFEKIKTSLNDLNSASSAIRKNLQSVGKSLDPVDIAIKTIGEAPTKIQELSNGFAKLKEQPKDVVQIIEKLNTELQNVLDLEKQGGRDLAWSKAYKVLVSDLQNVQNQLKLAQTIEKGSSSNTLVNDVANYKATLGSLKDEWKQQGLLIGNVKKEVASLQRGISGVRSPEKLQEYITRMQELSSNVQRLKTNLDSQVESQNKIYQIQTQISKLSSTDVSNKAYLEKKIHDEEKTLQNLQMQSGTLKNIISLEEQEAYVTQQVKKAREDATIAQNHQADTQMAKNIKQVNDYATAIEKSIDNLNKLKNSKIFADNSNKSSVQAQIAQIDQFVTKLAQMRETVSTMAATGNTTGKIDSTAFSTLVSDMANLNSQIKTVETSAKDLQVQLKQTNGVDTQKGKIKVLVAQLEAFAVANGKAMKSSKTLSSGMTVSQEWNAMMTALKSGADNGDIQKITSQFKAMRSEIKALGLEGGTVFQKLWADAKKFARWMGLTMVTSSIAREIRGMFTTIAELDTELIDLRKTFKGTSEDLEDFYYSANNVAKQLGVTTKEVISQASSWSRLGYSTKEAAIEMSKLSSMFASISPGMDVDTATTGLVSVMKAFKIDVDDVKEGIMSPINEIGNRFATDNDSIISGLSRSSAAMAAMNSTLSETIALFTAGQEVLQDSEKMGNALKSVAMRVRGYDEQTEELSDDLVDITGKVIDLTKVASNDYKGVSLFTDETQEHYKSIYDYLVQIADVYDELSEKNQQELLEKLFGKYQAQAGAAILSNIQAAKDVMNVIENESAGSADREMEVIKDSVDYAKNQLTETLTGIAQSSITRDFEKTILQSLTRVLDVLGDASSPLNGVLTTVSSIFDVVSKLIEKIGLIPTILAGISAKKLFQNIGTFSIKNWVSDLRQATMAAESFKTITTSFKGTGINAIIDDATIAKYTTSINGLTLEQAKLALSTTQLSASEKELILTKAGLITSSEALTAQETVSLVQQELGNKADAKSILLSAGLVTEKQLEENATISLTAAQIQEATSKGLLSVEDAKLIVSALGVQGANYGEAVSFQVLTKAIGGTIKAIGKFLISNPVGWLILLAGAITTTVAITDALTVSFEESKEELDNIKSECKKTEDELKSLNDELQTTAEKINELKGKDSLTFTEKEEYDNLVNTNNELQRKIDLLELEQKIENQKKNKTFVQTMVKDTENPFEHEVNPDGKKPVSQYSISDEYLTNETGYIKAQFEIRKKLLDDLSNSETDEERERIQKRLDDIEEYLTSKNDEWSEIANDISYIREPTTEDDKAVNEWLDYINDFQDKYAIALGGTNAKTNAFNRIVDNWQFDDAVQDLQDLGKQGKVTAKMLDDPKYDEFIDKLVEIGVVDSADNLDLIALAFNGMSGALDGTIEPTNNAVTAVTSLNDALTKLQELLKDIISGSSTYQSAMQKITAGTGLTAKEVNELLELDPSLFDKFIKQKDGTWIIPIKLLIDSRNSVIVDGGKKAIQEEVTKYQSELDSAKKDLEQYTAERNSLVVNDSVTRAMASDLDNKIADAKQRIQDSQKDLNLAQFHLNALDYSDADRIRDSYDDVVKKIDEYNDGITKINKAIESATDTATTGSQELDKFNAEMQKTYGLGNVDLTTRPKVELDDGSTATVLSGLEYLWQGDEENGQYVGVHITPILPNGEILSDEELSNYIQNTLADTDNILEADKVENGGKGLVLKVDTDLDLSEADIASLNSGSNLTKHMQDVLTTADEWDNKLHEVQEQWMNLDNTVNKVSGTATLSYDDMIELIELYPELSGKFKETAKGYSIEIQALKDVSKQAYQTRDEFIDSQIKTTQEALEETLTRIDAYEKEAKIMRTIVPAYDLLNAKTYKNLLTTKQSLEETLAKWESYKNEVKEPDSSSSKSADKSISDALQNQIDYYTTLLDAITAVADKQIDALEKEKDAIDSKIDALEDEKDALKDKNDEQQRELDLIEAQNNLDKAKKQKVFVYKEGEGLVQVQDEKAVKDAQKELDDVEREIKEADIDKQIEAYEKQQEAIDKQIDSANAYKDIFSDMESNAKDQLAIEQAKKALGVDENGLLHIDETTAKNIRDGLAEAIYNKDVNDNKDNDKYVTVSLADYLNDLGATVTPQQFQAIANTATGNTPITAPVTNSTVNNAQSIVNNKSITLNNTFNVYDSKDSNTVIEQIKSYMNKTLRTAINSIK